MNYDNATDRQLEAIVNNPYASKEHKAAAEAEIKKRRKEALTEYRGY